MNGRNVAELLQWTLVFMSLRGHLDFFRKLPMHVGTFSVVLVLLWVLSSNYLQTFLFGFGFLKNRRKDI